MTTATNANAPAVLPIAKIHPFESAGLGLAPFRFLGMTENVIRHADGHCQPGGHCHYCYTGIKYECNIGSSDGKTFIVGTDCVRKLGRNDNKLISDVEREVAKIEKAKRDEANRLKWEAHNAKISADLKAQRERNGGKTDSEVAQIAREDAARELAKKWSDSNEWLIRVLAGMPGDFVNSMHGKLLCGPVTDLSDRCVSILREIYGKAIGGRSGSKKYYAATEEFDKLAGIEEAE